MKFSIITPSFNQGGFIQQCLESVRLQAGVEIEHIVIDAGSRDNTLEILKNQNFAQWISESDNGMSDGINKGFLRATGDWVMWLNCDDYLLPGALLLIAEYAKEHPQVDVIHADCAFVAEDDQFIRRKYDTPVDVWDVLFCGCILPSTSTFLRRDIIQEGNLLSIEYRNCMDWEYYLRLFRKGYKFGYCPELLAHFRWHEGSTTQTNWQRMIDEGLRAQREHIKESDLPSFFENPRFLNMMRRAFLIRRVTKRIAIHGTLF